MRTLTALVLALLAAVSAQAAGEAAPWGDLTQGPYAVGFNLAALADGSRTFNSNPQIRGLPPRDERSRIVRVYQWYPAIAGTGAHLRLEDYARMAAEDFVKTREGEASAGKEFPLPVPLVKGLDDERRLELLNRSTMAFRDAEPIHARFPLILIGQGLYYESPLSQVVLAEYLASHGYVVATCPLLGTYSRLVNLSAVDLETEVRDLEFVLARVRAQQDVNRDSLGVVGYDLGGMAGLLLCMRNPDVGAFVSLDSGILQTHFSGLPASSPHYAADRFVIPWMHATQARFVYAADGEKKKLPLWDDKTFGDGYLLPVDTTSHGDFSSYAMFGLEGPVPGYWGPIQGERMKRHATICRYTLHFLDAYLKKDQGARDLMLRDVKKAGLENVLASVEFKQGKTAPPFADDYVQDIILNGTVEALPKIRQELASGKGAVRWNEKTLNWLGYHFLYWWGREKEAVDVFRLTTELFPQSANAFDSLGEAQLVLGDKEHAAESYRKSLQLDPKNENAKRVLERMTEK